ncbi:glutaminase A [Pseudonocardia sp. MH-G8]|uniref:glutaminase A n=1 Tax=Pseudonocardia sp. MH-G8 TaxID=1854588 RepID=UPI000BA09195|nr:glutaminase A [Pseudonocardia sp. MH-G8]OZM76060.1 glutaminase A [Pseudonocardia sp. MH-G8]
MVSHDEARVVQEQLEDLHRRHLAIGDDDVVSFYPPEAVSERHRFGIATSNVDGTTWAIGDADHRFPLHSISKVFTYGLGLEDNGREATRERVGVEPSGDPFNSISFDEVNNRPFNPMINAGALVAANLVAGKDGEEKVARLLDRVRRYAGNPDLEIDQDVLAEQMVSNDRNLGLSYLMRSLGMLHGDIEENILVYLSVCSVTVTARELGAMGGTLANGGVNPHTGERAMAREHVRDVISVMSTCGMYDAAGQWASDVGIPAKSGVSGGIMFALPGYFGGGVFSPGLDVHGNSVRGINLCRELSEQFGLHVYADPAESRFGRIATPDRRRR